MSEFKTLREDQKVLIQLRDMWKARAEQAEAKVQELKAEKRKWKERAITCARVLKSHGKDWEAVWEGQDKKPQKEHP